MTERELAQLPLLSREIEQVQARLQGPDLDPAAYCQSVRRVVAEHRAWMEELLELWRAKEVVDVLALPGLDVVCVEWQTEEKTGRAALFFASKLDCHNDFLRRFFFLSGTMCPSMTAADLQTRMCPFFWASNTWV